MINKGAVVLGVLEEFTSKSSYKTEQAITFIEKQLAILKEKNKTLQKTS